jgi:starch phosphorylase
MDPKVEMNKPLAKQKKNGSKFEMQGSDTNLYRPEFDHDDAKRTNKKEKMWELMATYLPTNKEAIQRQIVNHVEYTLARTRFNFDNYGAYQAAAFATRDRLIESWNDTNAYHKNQDVRRVYYMSLEFLMGRTF